MILERDIRMIPTTDTQHLSTGDLEGKAWNPTYNNFIKLSRLGHWSDFEFTNKNQNFYWVYVIFPKKLDHKFHILYEIILYAM
jgi:hypothetical protein